MARLLSASVTRSPGDGGKEDRLSVRATTEEKILLAQAAQAEHMNVSQFVRHASLVAARRILSEEATIRVSAEEYELLVRAMDEATPTPRLAEALKRTPVWDE